jgi:transposase-like protein
VYVAIFIDAIVVKVRDGQVANRPVYAAIGVTLEGRKDVLGLTMGTGGGEGAKFWMSVLVGLKEPRRARRVFPRLRWPGKFYPRWWTTSGHTLSCKRASFI